MEEYNWLFAAEKADSAGADVIQSSLGYSLFDDPQMDYKISDLNGATAVVSKAAGMARDRGIIVVTSAGNEGNAGWHFITPPADVDGLLAIGAINTSGTKASFSSFGPTADGRIKPDVVALGQGTAVIRSDGQVGTASGTSLSAPLVTSLVAGLLGAYPKVTPAKLVQAIQASASQGSNPDNQLGYGIHLEATQTGQDIYAYPNPATDKLSLAFQNLPADLVDISIYDTQGRLLSNPLLPLSWQSNPLEVSISTLEAGLYYMRIKTATLVRTIRFVKH